MRCRWLLGDIRHLVEVWRGAPAGYPGVFPSRLQTLADVLLPVRGTYHDNFTWRDPMPALGDWLHFLLHTLPRTARAAAGARRSWHAARALCTSIAPTPTASSRWHDCATLYRAAGCPFACVTDHAEAFDDVRLEAYRRECDEQSDERFRFIAGLEYGCEGRMHVLGYGVTDSDRLD